MAERVLAGAVEDWADDPCRVVSVGDAPVLVLRQGEKFFAVDNRCPHMGFPLHRGDVHDGLLDCHWHHARFDITCGGTLDPWADDIDRYRVVVEGGNVYVDPERPPRDPRGHGLDRIGRGLEHNLRLVTAKGAIELEQGGVSFEVALDAGARFGGTQNDRGWSSGLTILSCMANVYGALEPAHRARALTKALAWIAAECEGRPPRRPLPALEGTERDAAGLRTWLRETVEVRDADGAERVLRTLAETHGPNAALDAVLATVTDHRYCEVGHVLDFAVKAAELAERVDEALAVQLFTSLVPPLVSMQRMEETNTWRRPVDVASLVMRFAEDLPAFGDGALPDEAPLVALLLENDPEKGLHALVDRLREGVAPVALADAVVEAAVLRVLRFGKANEVPDWNTVHHTLTYANATAEAMRRVPSPELFRAVLDGAASVYLDRFLNLPPAKLPAADGGGAEDLLALYDQRASVDEAAAAAAGNPDLGTLGHALLREDAGFHDYQQVDIAWRRLERRGNPRALVAAARWLAARYPTQRAQEQTFTIAWRLHRGDTLFEA